MRAFTKVIGVVAAFAALAISTPVMAATLWLNGSSTASGAGRIFTNGDLSVRVTAWSIDTNNIIHSATLGVWADGLGVDNSDRYGTDNSHTVDNSGWKDFLLFQFDEIVELETAWFRTGWHSMSDTDATIGYDTVALSYLLQPGLSGQGIAALDDLNLYASNRNSLGNNSRDINPNDFSGNLWLIGASFSNPDKTLDGFKLQKLTYDIPPPAVPEPGTWLMMILGFGLIGGVMRARKAESGATAVA